MKKESDILMKEFDLEKYSSLTMEPLYKKYGKVVNVVGLTIESNGPEARLGDICYIYPDINAKSGIMAEVVGFKNEKVILMPYEAVDGIGSGSLVENSKEPLTVQVSNQVLGRTLDGL